MGKLKVVSYARLYIVCIFYVREMQQEQIPRQQL